MKSYQWLVVFFVSLIHLTAFTQRMDVVPFLVDLRDVYHVGYAEVGGLVSAFLLGYALFQIPAGNLADRYSPKLLILIGVLVMLMTSIISVFVHSLLFALVLRFLMGMSSAMLFSPGIKLISSYTPKRTRGSLGNDGGRCWNGNADHLNSFSYFRCMFTGRYYFYPCHFSSCSSSSCLSSYRVKRKKKWMQERRVVGIRSVFLF
jgi:sugar phosphate permease